MPNPASTSRPRPAPKSGTAARGLSVDELAAERNTPPLPPEPVFTIDLVEVEAETGKRGRKYVADLEERAHRNALAAAEARALALEQRRHLEDAAEGRRKAERQIAALNRELKTAIAEQQRLELRNRTRAAEPAAPAPVVPDPAAATSEVATLREAVEQQQRLLGEGRERLASALRERDSARLDARQATEARDRAKRSLDRATELLHEHALTESDRESRPGDGAADPQTTADLRAARLGVEARLLRLTDELDRLTVHAEQLEVRVAAETVRADDAEARLDELTATALTADGESASAREQLAAAAAREAEHAEARALLTTRVGELEAQLGVAIADRDERAREVQELEQQRATLESERDDARVAFEHFERTATGRADELETAAQLAADLRAQIERLTAQAGTAAAALAEADQLAADRASALETLTAQHATTVDELTQRLATSESERDELRIAMDAAADRAAALESEVTAVTTERDAARAQVVELATAAEDHLRKARAERDEARAQVIDLTAAAHGSEADLVAKVNDLETSLDRAQDEVAGLQAFLQLARDETAARDDELARLREEQTALDAALRASRDEVVQLTEHNAALEESFRSATTETGDRDEQLATLTQQTIDLEAELRRARADASAREEELVALGRRVDDAETARRTVEEQAAAQHQAAQAQVDRLGDRILELEQMVRSHESPPPLIELEDLAAVSVPDPEPPAPAPAAGQPVGAPPSSDLLRALRSELSDVNTVDAESRRHLLADLSDLADANPPPSTP
jgi:chromosome segregation ATPase